MGKFYITTPIYYVNAEPHIGHAYTQVIVDSLARYHRLLHEEVFFLTGTDEHGEKISEASISAGFSDNREKDFVDTIVPRFQEAWKKLNVTYDNFIRTTDPEHKETVRRMLQTMYDKGDIYEGEYDGWYCTPCETFWTETQLADGNICPECKRPVKKIKEKNYFFKLGKYKKDLLRHISENPDFIQPDFRKNEVLGFLKEELNDLCVSRPKSRMSWGLELPFDEGYVLYVWFDALINYLSGVRSREGLWPADIHMIAKDIIRHHAVYWPIMLMSAGIDLPMTIFAHGWWKIGDEKISKSKGNSVDPMDLAERYGVDALRYFLVKAVNLGLDGTFSEDALVTMYNAELANDLGNLLNRTLTMVEKYFDGVSPEPASTIDDADQARRSDALRDEICGILFIMYTKLNTKQLLIKEAIDTLMVNVVGKANKYIEESAPWKYAKTDNIEAIRVIISDLLEALRVTAIGLSPFMPDTAQKMWQQLGYKNVIADDVDTAELISPRDTSPGWRKFPFGMKVAKGDPLFPRIKD